MPDRSASARDALEQTGLRAMFAARKEVFIDLLGWDLPILAGRYEIDQFDTPAARYLVLSDAAGRHRGSARLLPTTGSHLLADIYPWLCHRPVPRGPHVREISRFCLDRNQDGSSRRAVRNQLVTALAEHALREGIADYTGVATLGWFRQIERFGWRCEALGQPVRENGVDLIALRIMIDGETITGLEREGIHAPLTFQLSDAERIGA